RIVGRSAHGPETRAPAAAPAGGLRAARRSDRTRARRVSVARGARGIAQHRAPRARPDPCSAGCFGRRCGRRRGSRPRRRRGRKALMPGLDMIPNMIPGFGTGNHSNLKVQRGVLVEYANTPTPLRLEFEFNPASITRTRAITVRTGGAPGTRGGDDFSDGEEVVRGAQGVTGNAEGFTAKILLGATDRR